MLAPPPMKVAGPANVEFENTNDSESSLFDMHGRSLEIGRCWRRSLSKQGQDSASKQTKGEHSACVLFFHIGSDEIKIEDSRTAVEPVCNSLCLIPTLKKPPHREMHSTERHQWPVKRKINRPLLQEREVRAQVCLLGKLRDLARSVFFRCGCCCCGA